MAILEDASSKQRHHLLARHLVGRSSLAHLRLGDPSISAEHALLCFTGREWEVRELGSRNGTTVDGRRLAAGERVPIARGATLAFGGSAARLFHLVDDGPPSLLARPEGGGELLAGDHDLLVLPDDERPEATVYRDAAGEWKLEREGGVERAIDGMEVSAGGQRFTLYLPDALVPTRETGASEAPPVLHRLAIRIEVSRDQEYVAVTLRGDGRDLPLGARAHHELLLALGRARLADQEEAAAAGPKASPESAHGWVYFDDLMRMLHLDEMHLNVNVYRCRRQLATAGVAGAANLIERRKPTRQLRLGVKDIEIVTV